MFAVARKEVTVPFAFAVDRKLSHEPPDIFIAAFAKVRKLSPEPPLCGCPQVRAVFRKQQAVR